jgi:hypothetical protein
LAPKTVFELRTFWLTDRCFKSRELPRRRMVQRETDRSLFLDKMSFTAGETRESVVRVSVFRIILSWEAS